MGPSDWTGTGRDTAEVYRAMAARELRGVSPSYEALCLAVADSVEVCTLLAGLETGRRQPNLLLAAVRYLGGPVSDPTDFLRFVIEGWDDVRAVILTHRTQTNEAGRCATLLPLLAALPQPLALLEVGASAGLCLYPDRYSYSYTGAGYEHWIGDSRVVLPCSVTGGVPLPDRLPEVVWRAGLDLNPLDGRSDEDRKWLAALIWPEQADRAERLELALDIVRDDPPRLETGDLLQDLPALVAEAPAGATIVVFHSAVLAYLGPEQRDQFTDIMHDLQASASVVWLSNEVPGVIPGTDLDPGHKAQFVLPHSPARFVLAHNQKPVALAGPHGHSLEWLAG